jgi:hypothetical protein
VSISPIVDLGQRLERRWQARDYELKSFPDLCAEELETAELANKVSPEEIAKWALTAELPVQTDPKAKFGQPPLTVFRTRRLHIDVLFWVDGTTAIHDHGFSGAFQVLAGGSIETTFGFSVTRSFDGRIQLGGLGVERTRLLKQGDVRPIKAGPEYIHSLFHLPRPSVSLVVRTFWDPTPGVQLLYYPAGIAHDAFFEDDARDRRLQLLDMLQKIDAPSFDALAGALVESGDLHTVFAVVRSIARLRDTRRQDALLQRVRDPALAALFGRWLEQERRQGMLRAARATVHDPELRFLLAVLLNTHRKEDALSLVSEYAPGADPARKTAEWLRQLSAVTFPLQVAQGGWQPNVLGLPAFEPGFEEALAGALAGRSNPGPEQERFLAKLGTLSVLAPLFVD